MKSRKFKPTFKWLWWFIWEDDSLWSWLVNIVLAFILIKFIVYPLLGLLLTTTHPIVAVVSGSMEHDGSFNSWWSSMHNFYDQAGIAKEEFKDYRFKNGFNKGDLIVLKGKDWNKLEIGEVIVYQSSLRVEPIIHRIVRIYESDGKRLVQTKGDHNSESNPDELRIQESQYIGNGLFRIPWLGWVKIGFVGLLKFLRVI